LAFPGRRVPKSFADLWQKAQVVMLTHQILQEPFSMNRNRFTLNFSNIWHGYF